MKQTTLSTKEIIIHDDDQLSKELIGFKSNGISNVILLTNEAGSSKILSKIEELDWFPNVLTSADLLPRNG